MIQFQRIYLEITNCCNRHCSFCPGTKRPPCSVTPSQFDARLRKIQGYTDQIYLHVLGEPLLHPQLSTLLDIARRNQFQVNLTTNGTLLPHHRDPLLHPAIRQINFSLHALTPEESGLLDEILRFAKSAETTRPELYLNFRLWNETPQKKVMESDNWILEKIATLWDRPEADCLPSAGRRSRKLSGRTYLNVDTVFEWPVSTTDAQNDARTNTTEPVPGFCHAMLDQLAVLSDGTVVPCCLDSEGVLALGNLDSESLETILDSSAARHLRDSFSARKIVAEFCKTCTFRTRFDR